MFEGWKGYKKNQRFLSYFKNRNLKKFIMQDLIRIATAKGAKIYSNVSGGKDGQAMTMALLKNGFNIEGLVHADLGRVEWKQSHSQCEQLSTRFNIPLHIVKRNDKLDMLAVWQKRMKQLQFPASVIATREEVKVSATPFWSSSSSRYCTSDLKRDPITVFYNSTGNDFIISAEGIRAGESVTRSKKNPLTVNDRNSSSIYKGMTAEEAINAFTPGKKLVLTWFPIFNFTTEEVWNTLGNTSVQLEEFRKEYQATGVVNAAWNFHPAYVFGNERVSCMMCVLGSISDLENGAKHNPELHAEMVSMEKESGFTFRMDFSLTTMTKIKKETKKSWPETVSEIESGHSLLIKDTNALTVGAIRAAISRMTEGEYMTKVLETGLLIYRIS